MVCCVDDGDGNLCIPQKYWTLFKVALHCLSAHLNPEKCNQYRFVSILSGSSTCVQIFKSSLSFKTDNGTGVAFMAVLVNIASSSISSVYTDQFHITLSINYEGMFLVAIT